MLTEKVDPFLMHDIMKHFVDNWLIGSDIKRIKDIIFNDKLLAKS